MLYFCNLDEIDEYGGMIRMLRSSDNYQPWIPSGSEDNPGPKRIGDGMIRVLRDMASKR